MTFRIDTWLKGMKRKLSGKRTNQRGRLRPRVQLRLEVLEDRVVPASYTVTSTADDGSAGTLRWAVDQANNSTDPTNSISIEAGIGTIVLTNGSLMLNNPNSTTITGPGIIDGDNSSDIFVIEPGTTVELDNLTLQDASGYGGAIYNQMGTLTVNNCTFTGNNGYGAGGIYNYSTTYGGNETVTINNCTFTDDTGGAITNWEFPTATINNCTFTDNPTGSGAGGGITNYFDSNSIGINNCTFTGNTAAYGGAVYNAFSGVTINNCVLSGNTGSVDGGGIYCYASSGSINDCSLTGNTAAYGGGMETDYSTVVINNSTIAGNTANIDGGGMESTGDTLAINDCTISGNAATGEGGGILDFYGDNLTLANTIVAGNNAGTPYGYYAPDVDGYFSSLGHNLIGIADGSRGFANGVNGDLVGSAASPLDPKLGTLTNYGSTWAMALLPGSPAIDAGSNALIPIDPSTGLPFTTDQIGDPRISGASVDIGAYESQGTQASQTITFNALPNHTYGDADFALTATASSGLPVNYSASGNATVYQDTSGNWFAHITGAGSATITASQAGNNVYAAAPNVSQTFNIAQATTALSNLTGNPTALQIIQGTNTTTVSGQLTSNTTALPVGQNVAITINGVTQSATVGGTGSFSTSFATGALGVGAYPISYTYAGDSNFTASSGTGSLTVVYTPQVHVVDAGGPYNGTPFPATATAVGIDGVTPVAGTFSYAYYAGTNTAVAPLPAVPVNAGTYTVVAAFTSADPNYSNGSAQTTFTIAQATTGLGNLTTQQIIVGTNTTTVAGKLTSNTIAIPAGQSIAITLNGVTQSALVGADGSFSTSFATGALAVGAYTISYSYAGDNNFSASSGTGSLTVIYGTQVLFNNTKPFHSPSAKIKLELTNASGADISAPNIAVTATSLVDSNGNPVPLGNDLFSYDPSGAYTLNLPIKGSAAGTYTMYYKAGNDPTLHSLTFVVA